MCDLSCILSVHGLPNNVKLYSPVPKVYSVLGRLYNGVGVGRIPWHACSVRCSNSRNALTWDLRKGVALPMKAEWAMYRCAQRGSSNAMASILGIPQRRLVHDSVL